MIHVAYTALGKRANETDMLVLENT